MEGCMRDRCTFLSFRRCVSVRENPFQVVVVPAITKPEACTVSGSGTQSCVAGVLSTYRGPRPRLCLRASHFLIVWRAA